MNSKIIILSSIMLLGVTIPNAFADSFDEETCLGLISIEQVADITGYDGVIEINVINSNLESLNEGIANGCAIAFQNDDTSFSLALAITASESDRTAQSNYGEVFSAAHQMSSEVIEGNNGPWIHHAIEVHENGIGSFLASIKDNIQVGLNAPSSEIPIKASELVEVLEIIQSNIDKLDIPKSYSIEPDVVSNEKTSEGLKIIFDGCDDQQAWMGHVENNGQTVYDAKIIVYNQEGGILSELGVNQKHGNFGVGTIGQDPSSTAGSIQAIVEGEPGVYYDNITCIQTIEPTPVLVDQSNVDRPANILSVDEIENIWNQKKNDCSESYTEQNEIEFCLEVVDNWKADRLRENERYVTEDPREENGGGCLIATATYGSEMAPQVQQLRELRDNQLLQTESGTNFMNSFNDVYYTFSPIIADYERENPVFKEMVKISITPMISSLSILNNVEMDSESSVLGYGISLILLNVGMYVGIPIAIVVGIRRV